MQRSRSLLTCSTSHLGVCALADPFSSHPPSHHFPAGLHNLHLPNSSGIMCIPPGPAPGANDDGLRDPGHSYPYVHAPVRPPHVSPQKPEHSYATLQTPKHARPPSTSLIASCVPVHIPAYPSEPQHSEGGMIRLETLNELNYVNSSISNSNFSIRAFRAYPLIGIRRTVPCRAIRGNIISVNSTLPPSYTWTTHAPACPCAPGHDAGPLRIRGPGRGEKGG